MAGRRPWRSPVAPLDIDDRRLVVQLTTVPGRERRPRRTVGLMTRNLDQASQAHQRSVSRPPRLCLSCFWCPEQSP